jgi:peptidoglycan/LPS O-acetylase OafA/YrhL
MATDKNIHIPSLDGIRAVAALSVFGAHAGLLWGLNLAPGGFGVTIFFFLSGYLITTLLRLERERSGTISFKNFYLRRVFRIFPPMYLVLALNLMLVFTGIAPSAMTPGALLAQFGHLSNYYIIWSGEDHIVPGSSAMWSLAVEEHFYLIYPLLLTLLLRRLSYPRTAMVLLSLCVLVLLWRCYLIFDVGVQRDYTYMATDTRFDSLLYGCIMGIALNPALDPHILDFGRRRWLLLLAGSAALLAFCFIYRSYAFRETFRYSIQGIALFPVFFCAIRYSKWPGFAWLNLSWVRGLGLISYTFYLIHLTALAQSADILRGYKLLIPVLAFVMAVAFSTAMYFLVERRMSVLRHKLHR